MNMEIGTEAKQFPFPGIFASSFRYCVITVKKVIKFSVPSKDFTNQTLPGGG